MKENRIEERIAGEEEHCSSNFGSSSQNEANSRRKTKSSSGKSNQNIKIES